MGRRHVEVAQTPAFRLGLGVQGLGVQGCRLGFRGVHVM